MNVINITAENFAALQKGRVRLEEIYYLERGDVSNADVAQTLKRKGWVDEEGQLTKEGTSLLSQLKEEGEVVDIKKVVLDRKGITGLHEKLEAIIVKYTGKKQVRGDIKGTKYSFLCGETDLINQVVKVIAKYRITNYSSLEATLIKYVERACKTKQYFPTVFYYISKDGQSRLVADMGDVEEKEIEELNTERINPENLF